jgi:hypothetical protein
VQKSDRKLVARQGRTARPINPAREEMIADCAETHGDTATRTSEFKADLQARLAGMT